MQEIEEIPVRSLGWEDPLEEGMATHPSILAWRIWIEEPGGLQFMGSQKVGHNWNDLAHTNSQQATKFHPSPWPEVDYLASDLTPLYTLAKKYVPPQI